MPRCDDLLSECWWRNSDRNCCEIFEVQKTEYGFCYSFNSELSETYKPDPFDSRPRRASGYGDWSGVRVTIHLGNITKPPDSSKYCRHQCNILRGETQRSVGNTKLVILNTECGKKISRRDSFLAKKCDHLK